VANVAKPARDTAIPRIAQREDVSWATIAPATKPPTISQIAMRFLLATAAGSVGRVTKGRLPPGAHAAIRAVLPMSGSPLFRIMHVILRRRCGEAGFSPAHPSAPLSATRAIETEPVFYSLTMSLWDREPNSAPQWMKRSSTGDLPTGR
jgi:hypothetical protein